MRQNLIPVLQQTVATLRSKNFAMVINLAKSNSTGRAQFGTFAGASRGNLVLRKWALRQPGPACSRRVSLLSSPGKWPESRPRRIVVGVTGATGATYAIRLLETLKDLGVETHLVMSKWAVATLKYETDSTEQDIRELASVNHTAKNMSAPIASGSFQHDGMIVVPCSMKTLAAIRTGLCDDLISRAADVSLKEDRKLVMVVRETPLSDIHLENMLSLHRAGATIFPPVPALYTRPTSFAEIVDQSVGRMLDSLDIHVDTFERWNGFEKRGAYVKAMGDR
jgi:4-hydroxy-3-polyprenylbenzoate decarboxylase